VLVRFARGRDGGGRGCGDRWWDSGGLGAGGGRAIAGDGGVVESFRTVITGGSFCRDEGLTGGRAAGTNRLGVGADTWGASCGAPVWVA